MGYHQKVPNSAGMNPQNRRSEFSLQPSAVAVPLRAGARKDVRADGRHALRPRRVQRLNLSNRTVAHEDSGGKAQGSIELELSAVVAVDGGEIEVVGPIQLLQRRNGLLRAIHQLQQIAGAAGFANAPQACHCR